MGLRGRLEAMTAPTMGKARNSTNPTVSPEVLIAEGSPGEGRGRMLSTLAAEKMATESAANDQASHTAARFPLTWVCCSFVSTVTKPLYRTGVCQTLRPALRESLQGSRSQHFRRMPKLTVRLTADYKDVDLFGRRPSAFSPLSLAES